VSLHVQFLTFFMMFASGWSLGVLFDVYRVVSRSLRLAKWSISILDMFYWVAATLFVFRILYYSNQGEVRLFVFLGLLLGTWIYFYFISSFTVITVKYILKLLKRMFDIGVRCVELLVIRPIILLYKLFIILLGILTAITMFLFKIVVQLFYPFWVIIKWLGQWIRKTISWPSWIRKTVKWFRQKVNRFF
jgi:spore cortex biosynthesis protein YabQ